jgi:hypothetical protein
MTHFDSYKFQHASRIPNKGRIPGKISRPNRTYTKLDLFQSGRIPRYHCIKLLLLII